jgi:serine/threonine-protein kinase
MQLVAQVSVPETPSLNSALPAVGSLVAGRYQIDRLIACGGMGAVFEAHHRKSGRRYALKWILPKIASESDARSRFEREAAAGLQIRHPNVARAFAVGEDRGSPFLVMELLDGRSLQRLIATGPLTLERAMLAFLPLLDGVGAIHQSGIVHRDLKPDNVLLVRGHGGLEVPKVLDFGLCKPIAHDEDLARITRRDIVLGTPAFTAPEQLLGEAVDARADVYSLGVLLYTMLAGRRPFEAANYNRLLFQIATERPAPLSQLQPALPAGTDAVVQRAMARERDARFACVDEFAQALLAIKSGRTVRVTRAAS